MVRVVLVLCVLKIKNSPLVAKRALMPFSPFQEMVFGNSCPGCFCQETAKKPLPVKRQVRLVS